MNKQTNQFIVSPVKTARELKLAMSVRREVFVEEQHIDEREEYDGLDEIAIQFVVKYGGKVVGTARVRFISPGCAKIERMAVLEQFRRQSAGKCLLEFILESIHPIAKQVVLHAQREPIPFYRTCGFEAAGEPFEEAGIKHIKMIKSYPRQIGIKDS